MDLRAEAVCPVITIRSCFVIKGEQCFADVPLDVVHEPFCFCFWTIQIWAGEVIHPEQFTLRFCALVVLVTYWINVSSTFCCFTNDEVCGLVAGSDSLPFTYIDSF